MIYTSLSYEETKHIACEFAKKIKPGDVITLDGDLGAGKTAFVTGFVSGFDITDKVTSPTFTIVNEYRNGKVPVFHFDVYRLDSMDDLYDIGWDDYLYQNGIYLIEWADIIRDELEKPYYEIRITKRNDISDDARDISIKFTGEDI